jgi:nucleoside-diphosphate-sugar epimerase
MEIRYMTRTLVTGGAGFVVPYLILHLLKLGYELTGVIRGLVAPLLCGCQKVGLDVTDLKTLSRVVAEIRSVEDCHLAGVTRPASSAAEEFYHVKFSSTLNLLEVVRECTSEARVLLVGSAYL